MGGAHRLHTHTPHPVRFKDYVLPKQICRDVRFNQHSRLLHNQPLFQSALLINSLLGHDLMSTTTVQRCSVENPDETPCLLSRQKHFGWFRTAQAERFINNAAAAAKKKFPLFSPTKTKQIELATAQLAQETAGKTKQIERIHRVWTSIPWDNMNVSHVVSTAVRDVCPTLPDRPTNKGRCAYEGVQRAKGILPHPPGK